MSSVLNKSVSSPNILKPQIKSFILTNRLVKTYSDVDVA